jgi:hypothetical protein
MASEATSSDDLTMPITGTLRVNLEALSVALSQWERRDDTEPQPEIRQAANEAMDVIHAIYRELHALRSRLGVRDPRQRRRRGPRRRPAAV